MSDQVKVSVASLVIAKHASICESARIGTPPGFRSKVAVPEVVDEQGQPVIPQEVAPSEDVQGGGAKPPQHETPSVLMERLPELPARVRCSRGGRPSHQRNTYPAKYCAATSAMTLMSATRPTTDRPRDLAGCCQAAALAFWVIPDFLHETLVMLDAELDHHIDEQIQEVLDVCAC